MPSPLEQRVRDLCTVICTARGAEQEAALAELESALPALIREVGNFSKFNLINFPSALQKARKKEIV